MVEYVLEKNEYYKLAKPDGWDFYTGKTINYRDNIGKTVKVENLDNPVLCSLSVLHASKVAVNGFVGAVRIPCSMFIVEGKKVVEDKKKSGFKELFVKKEIQPADFDEIFGFKYQEALQPLDPRKISREKKIGLNELRLLHNWSSVWDSVWDSVRDSVWDSVRDSVWGSVRSSVWDSVWGSVRSSVWDSVWDSVRDSVWGSVWDSVWNLASAYIGSLFYKITQWQYVKCKNGEYPFISGVKLLQLGLVPVFGGTNWYLLGNEKMDILWEGTKEDLNENVSR